MAPSIKNLFKDPGFYFKVIEVGIAIALTVIHLCSSLSHGTDFSVHTLNAVVVYNSIITITVLIIIFILDKKNDDMEICILLGTGICAIGLGTHLFCYISKDAGFYYLLVSSLTIGLGVVCILDSMRLAKSLKI